MEYKPLTIPKIEWNKKLSTSNFGELIAGPLEPGYGTTLGNALRRVMLAAIEGPAVTSVIIKGAVGQNANNEFATLDGIAEDVLQVLLNIKEIIIKNSTGEPGTMRLHVTGEGVAKVADITADEHLELVNKEHVLAHVAPGGELEIEFFVENGRGYQRAEWPIGEKLQSDNRIFVDSMFSPVRRVEYHIEKTRVGKAIDYDKLTMRITTDGSVLPYDVLDYATSVIRTQLEHFLAAAEIPFNEISEVPAEVVVEVSEAPVAGALPAATAASGAVELYLKPIEELELSVRAHNCLISHGIKRVIDLVNMTEDEVLKIKNFGRKSLREIREVLGGFGLALGMNVKELDLKKMIKEQEDMA